MGQSVKKISMNIVAGIITAVICAGLLFLSALIPQEMIQDNCYESACYFAERETYPNLKKGYFFTRQDNFGDCLMTHISWQIEEEEPVISALKAPYYTEKSQGINYNFINAMEQELAPNTEHARYWNGSMVFLRPLFMWFSITQIRIVLAVIFLLEMVVATVLLSKTVCRGENFGYDRVAAICFVLALLLVHAYLAATSVECITTFMIMGAVLIRLLHGLKKNIDYQANSLFVVSGVVTCFVDQLTTETITYTMPMAIMLLVLYKEGKLTSVKEGLKQIFSNGICWFLGYAGMFAAKWLINGIVLGKEIAEGAFSYAMVRVGGEVVADAETLGLTMAEQLKGAIWNNLGCLFLFKNQMTGAQVLFGACVVIIVAALAFYLFRGKEVHQNLFVPLLVLALVPYVRFLMLSNHAFRHYFFTYRTQIITVFVFLLFVAMDIVPGIKRVVKPESKKGGR